MRSWDVLCLIVGLQCFWRSCSVGVSAQSSPPFFICSTECSGQEAGLTASYNFSIQHRLTSTVNEEAGLVFLVTGTATIQGYAGCNYEMRVNDVEFKEVRDGGEEYRQTVLEQKLSQNPLRFGLSTSGVISDVCPVASEEPFALNIKLAILSHLQWAKDSNKVPVTKLEDDIYGRCVTHYTPINDDEGRVRIRRTKSLAECSRRYENEFIPNATDYNLVKALMELVEVNGAQTCNLSPDDDGLLSSADCSEDLTITGGIGAGSRRLNTLSVTSKFVRLPNTKESSLTPDNGITFRRTAFAPSFVTAPGARQEYREVEEAVVLIAVMLRTDNWSGAANFLKLIEILRSLSLEDYSELYSMFATNSEALQIIFQAAVYVKTEDAFNFLKTGITKGHLTLPLYQLSLLEAPTISQIQALKAPLLMTDFKAYALVTSTLVDKFCLINKDCLEMPPLRSILEELQSHLGTSCSYGDNQSMEKVLLTLRAIGNLGRAIDAPLFYQTLSHCLTDRSNNVFVRASAAESLRKFECDEQVDTILMRSMNDSSEDTEVRIQAYRSWARCLTTEKLEALANVLREETSQQFRSFVAQHLQSLLKSGELLKRHNIKMTPDEFHSLFGNSFEWIWTDLRRYSGYVAKAFTNEQMAGKVEVVSIAGTQNPFSRYASVNISVNLKGREFNLLEVGYRSARTPPFANLFFGNSWGPNSAQEMIGPKENISRFDHIVNQALNREDTTALFVRLFGHEVVYSAGDMRPWELTEKKLVRWLSQIPLNEKVTFVTSGGLSLQSSMLLATSHRIADKRGLHNSLLDLDTRLSLELQSTATFLLPIGLVGFRTNDRLYVNLELGVSLSASSSASGMQLEFNYRGSDSKKPLIKYSRKVTEVGSRKEEAVKAAGDYVLTTSQTPKLFDSLFGLVATYEQGCLVSEMTQEVLCISRQLTLEKNDGLAFAYSRTSEALPNGVNRTLRLAISRPRGKMEVPATGSLLHLDYGQVVTHSGKTDLTVRLTAPWKKTYLLKVSAAADGKYTGILELGSWKADISGEYRVDLPSQRYATFNLRSAKDKIWAVYNSSGLATYSLRAVGKGTTLPFKLKSKNKYLPSTHESSEGKKFLFSHETEFRSPRLGECELEGLIDLEQNAKEWSREGKLKFSVKNRDWKTKISAHASNSFPVDRTAEELKWKHMLAAKYEQTGMESLVFSAGSKIKLERKSNLLVSRQRLNSTLWLENSILPLLAFRTEFIYENDQRWSMDKSVRTEATLNIKAPAADVNSRFGVNFSARDPYMKAGGSMDTIRTLSLWAVPQAQRAGLTLDFNMTANKRLHQIALHLQAGQLCNYRLTSLLDAKARQHTLNLTSFSQPILEAETTFGLRTGEAIHLKALTNLALFSSPPHRLETDVQLRNGMRQLELNQSCLRMTSPPVTLYATNVSFDLLPDRKMKGMLILDIPQLPWLKANEAAAAAAAGKSNRLSVKFQRDGSESVRCSLTGQSQDSSELKFKFKVDRKQPAAGDVSVMLAVVPGEPTEAFRGIFYKSTSQFAFTETEKSCSHEGEWNANRGYAPGMPFRFGVNFKHDPAFRQGSINAFAEDTNLGKATDFELAEALYEFSLSHPDDAEADGTYQLRSEYMLNWRRFLSRGVSGTQGFLNANLSRDFREGDLIFNTHLTDIDQSSLEVIFNYLLREKRLLVTSNAQLEGRPVYTAEMSVLDGGESSVVDFSAKTAETGGVEAFNLTAQCTYPLLTSTPCKLIYQSATREACIVNELTEGTRVREISWNRLNNGSVILKTSESDVLLRTPVGDIGLKRACSPEDVPCQYYVYTNGPNRGGRQSKHFLQISFRDAPTQTELQSSLLKTPIFIEVASNPSGAEAAAYRGVFDDRIDPIARASYQLVYSGPQECKHQLRLERLGKVYTLSGLQTLDDPRVHHVGNFSIDGKEGTYDFLYIPDRLLRGKISGPALFQMEVERKFGLNTGNFLMTMNDKGLLTQGSWLLQERPPIAYFRLDNSDTKRIFKATVKDVFNVSAEEFLWSEKTQGKLASNARFKSELTTDGLLKTHTFLRPFNAPELVVEGIETIMDNLNNGFSAYFGKKLRSLVQTQLSQLLEEVNQTAVSELYDDLFEGLEALLQTMQTYREAESPVIGQLERQAEDLILWIRSASQSGELSKFLDALYETPTSLLEKIRSYEIDVESLAKRLWRIEDTFRRTLSTWLQDVHRIMDPISQKIAELVAKGATVRENLYKTRDAIAQFWTNKVFQAVRAGMESIGREISALKSAKEYFADLLDSGLNMMRQVDDYIWLQTVMPVEDEFRYPLQHILNGDVKKAVEAYLKPEMASFKADWGAISVNTTFFVPPRVQEKLRPLLSRRKQVEWLDEAGQYVLREFQDTARPRWSPNEQFIYNAWLFLQSAGRMQILTFDGDAQSFVPKAGTSYLLLRDFFTKAITLTMELGPQDVYFNLYLDGGVHIRLRHSGDPGKVYQKAYKFGKGIEYAQTGRFWSVNVNPMQLQLLFDLEQGSLRVSVGRRWHGSFRGLLGSNDLEAANDRLQLQGEQSDYDISSWRVSGETDTLADDWSLGSNEQETVKASEVDQIFKERLQCIPAPYLERFIKLAKAGSQGQEDTNLPEAHTRCPPVHRLYFYKLPGARALKSRLPKNHRSKTFFIEK
ncbi:hypothetical protein SprV_0301065900 [Sparganum proliferum]